MIEKTTSDSGVDRTDDQAGSITGADIIEISKYRADDYNTPFQQNMYLPSSSPDNRKLRRTSLPTSRIPRSDITQIAQSEFYKTRLREALFIITDAIDFELNIIERSNCFDEWKDILQSIARLANCLTIDHSQILGTLLSVTNRKDLSDFSMDALKLFRDATNILRQQRVTQQESKRIIDSMIRLGIKATIPLAVENLSEDQTHSLDELMSFLINKSKNNK